MQNNGNHLHVFEWLVSIALTAYCGVLAYFGIIEKNLSLGGRFGGVAHFHGLGAVIVGFAFLAGPFFCFSMLLRIHPYKRLLQFVLFLFWLLGGIIYFLFFYQ
jgi:heme/copper-type cytochrome/quinol oxidase subunit 1